MTTLNKNNESIENSPKLSIYEEYTLDPTPKNLKRVVDDLKPTISSVLATYQSLGDQNLQAQARIIAGKAVQQFDPSQGTSLPTWVSSQLRQLSRAKRQSSNIINVPEGIQLDAFALQRAENEFIDTHGREPSVDELADFSKFSIKRIEAIRKKFKPISSDASYNTEDGATPSVETIDYSKDAIDYVYPELDYIDKKLLEYKTGYGGSEILSTNDIKDALKLNDVQLSRRTKRIALRINTLIQALQEVQSL